MFKSFIITNILKIQNFDAARLHAYYVCTDVCMCRSLHAMMT